LRKLILLLLKNQEYTSYFEKLSFGEEIDIGELEKLFNFCEYFPSPEEMNEAKMNVLNCNTHLFSSLQLFFKQFKTLILK
jgi:hypothetical protein